MRDEVSGSQHDWLDAEAGPVVRPYAVTAGRVRPATGKFDLMAFVVAGPPGAGEPQVSLQPEHRAIVAMTQRPLSVAEVAARLDLAVGVVRVLLGDLLAAGLISLYEPPETAGLPNEDILRAVVEGLRAL